ncbi:hypothetical protein [Noviherbaspirillum galbum]|uniref:Uncharacterized protein n=1 Tax=Noviherbaspirillum galbum TaxID=2709383 RepID=A0A6B3SMN0_9BURK|nr:hypothetical protein [Noviherbaspirillum galbum]NEX59966.1 hypothetical protein [Noviherbaspirillum galbum]
MTFSFRLMREDDSPMPAVVFEDSTNPGLVPVWDAAGVYDALYNSDGRQAREISRTVAYGLDRLQQSASLAKLVPPTATLDEAIRFLENVHRGCTIHPSARVATA